MVIRIINLTPHDITLIKGDEQEVFPKSIAPARVATTKKVVGTLNGSPINSTAFGAVENLPEPQEGTVYIVSAIVAQAVKDNRNDCFIVDETVRNEAGQIIGCKAFGIV